MHLKSLVEVSGRNLLEAKKNALEDIPSFTEAFSSMNEAPRDLLKELYSKVIDFRE